MTTAKQIEIRPIAAKDARRIVKQFHYSGKVVANSQVNFGVFLNGRCGGALQFGPSMDKHKLIGLVEGTKWNEFIELNRMAFADFLPRNSESRAISICLKILKREYPFLKWVVTFADGTQCGDGTIYRAAGFLLTQIRENATILRMPNGETVANLRLQANGHERLLGGKYFGVAATKRAMELGAKFAKGYQLRYVKLLRPGLTLTCGTLPYDEIKRRGASMYLGVRSADSGTVDFQSAGGGASPTRTLQFATDVAENP